MIYPDFKELLSYERASKDLSAGLKKKLSSSVSGNYMSSFRGQGVEFRELRQYVYGDDIRNIQWRVSARSPHTFVKTYHEERQRNVIICVDNNDYMNFGTRSTFKNVQAARAAAIIGFAANRNNDKVGFYIFGNQQNRFSFFKPTNSKKSLFAGLKTLCAQKGNFDNYSLEGAIFNLKRIDANPNIIFVISDFRESSEQLEQNFSAFGRNPDIVLINISDDSDFNMPDFGKIMIEYGERRYLLNSSSRRGAERYRKIYNEKMQNFKKMAAKLHAKIININTKDDVLREVTIGLKANNNR